ncbi:MAG: hypothetical protein K6F30_10140 [Lachnospiraceae bacterium]|nr:hypothetical protein [Lachnospiraceae bacterium]
MLKLKNGSVEEFERETDGKKVVCFGALIMPSSFCKANRQYHFEDRIACLVDNDETKWGKKVELDNNVERKVFPPEKLREIADDNLILLITSRYFVSIVQQLDAYTELNGTVCYIYPFMQYDRAYVGAYRFKNLEYELIPKKIHYIWFGNNRKPDLVNKCIASWKKNCPDYEIIEWNEQNYDVEKNCFMKEAYEAEKWGFVSDYARLDIVSSQGGIYFDTDVELIKGIDELLCNGAFFGFGNYGRIATGLGFGAIKGHYLIERLKKAYKDVHFYDLKDSKNVITNTMREEPVFSSFGVEPDDSFQVIKDVAFFPADVFSPLVPGFPEPMITKNTLAIHYGTYTWESEANRAEIGRIALEHKKMRERFKKDVV